MASRNSFLDSPNFRRITQPQRKAIDRVRRSKGFRGGGTSGGSSIRKLTPTQQGLSEVQKRLSATGIKLSDEDVKRVLAGKNITTRTLSNIRTSELKQLQSRLADTGVKLSSQDAENILTGRGVSEGTLQRISAREQQIALRRRQAKQQAAARLQRKQQTARGFTTQTITQQAPFARSNRSLSDDFVGPTRPLQPTTQPLNTVSEREQRDDLFLAERFLDPVISRAQSKAEQRGGLVGGLQNVGLSLAQVGSEGLSIVERTARTPFVILPTGPNTPAEKFLKESPVQARVLEDTENLVIGLGKGLTQPRQTLFEIAEPIAVGVQRARSGVDTESRIGRTIGNVALAFSGGLITKSAQSIGGSLARLRSDFIPTQRVRGRTIRATADGVTTKNLDAEIIPNIPSADKSTFDTIILKGGTASTAEDLATQTARAGTRIDLGTSATSSLVPIGQRRGRLVLREIDNDIENALFITPKPEFRRSRLGVGVDEGNVLEGVGDLISGNAQIGFGGGRPQALLFRNADIEDFPSGLKQRIQQDPSLSSFTQQELAELQAFQLQKRSTFTVPGKPTAESEAITTADLLDFERVGTGRTNGRRLAIFDTKPLLKTDIDSSLTPNIDTPSTAFDDVVTTSTRQGQRRISGESLITGFGTTVRGLFRQQKDLGTIFSITDDSVSTSFDIPSRPPAPSSPKLFPTRTPITPRITTNTFTGGSSPSTDIRNIIGGGSGGGGSPSRISIPRTPATPPRTPRTPTRTPRTPFLRVPPRTPRTPTNPLIPNTPTPRRDFDFDREPRKKKKDKDKKGFLSPGFKFKSSLVGIEIGKKEKKKKAKGFKGLEIRGI